MKAINNSLCIVFLLIAWIGCKPSNLEPNEFIAFVEDPKNHLRISQSAGGYYFELQYKPANYVALKELGIKGFNCEKYSKRTKELSGLVQFNLRLQHLIEHDFLSSQNSDPQGYFERLQYYSISAGENMMLITGKDTLLPSLYHFEHTHNLAPYNTVVLGFEHSDQVSTDWHFIYDDQELGTGPIKFSLDTKNLEAIPELKPC